MITDRGERLRGRWPAWLVIAATFLGLVLRLYHLGAQNLMYDEVRHAQVASQLSLGGLLAGVKVHMGAAPLDYLLLHIALLLGQSDWIARFPAVIYGTLAIPAVYVLGTRLFGRVEGIIAAWLLALSRFAVQYSQEVRFYSLFMLLALLGTWLFHRALQRNTRSAWAAFTLCSIAGLYSHYYYALILVVQGAYLLLSHPRVLGRPRLLQPHSTRALALFIGSGLVAGLAFAPWVLYDGLGQRGLWPGAAPPLDWYLIRQVILSGWTGQRGDQPSLWWFAVAALVGTLPIRRGRNGVILCLLGLVLSVIAAVTLARARDYFFNIRQLHFVLPLFLLLIARGVTLAAEGARWLARRVAYKGQRIAFATTLTLLAGTMGLLSFGGTQSYYAVLHKIDWSGLVDFLEENGYPGGKIVVVPQWKHHPLIHYAPAAPVLLLRKDPAGFFEDLQKVYGENDPLLLVRDVRVAEDPAITEWLAGLPYVRFRFRHVDLLYLHHGQDDEALMQETADWDRTSSVLDVGQHVPEMTIVYRVYFSGLGWLSAQTGAVDDTTEVGHLLEAVAVDLENAPPGTAIQYRVHVQGYGWMDWVNGGGIAGLPESELRLEAIQVRPINWPSGWRLQYEAHVQGLGWMGWLNAPDVAGTVGQSLRVEALRFRISSLPAQD